METMQSNPVDPKWMAQGIEPIESEIRSNAQESEEVTRRNFYLTLFRLYSNLPINDCLASYTKIFNDVFTQEKPSGV